MLRSLVRKIVLAATAIALAPLDVVYSTILGTIIGAAAWFSLPGIAVSDMQDVVEGRPKGREIHNQAVMKDMLFVLPLSIIVIPIVAIASAVAAVLNIVPNIMTAITSEEIRSCPSRAMGSSIVDLFRKDEQEIDKVLNEKYEKYKNINNNLFKHGQKELTKEDWVNYVREHGRALNGPSYSKSCEYRIHI